MKNILITFLAVFSVAAHAGDSWWIYSGGSLNCEAAKFSPWQVLEFGEYQIEKYYKEKQLVFLSRKDNPNSMLIYSISKQNCEAVAKIVVQSQTTNK